MTSHRDFLQQVLRALRAKKSWGIRLRKWLESIPRLRPKLSIPADQSTGGKISLSAEVSSDKDVKETIQDVIGAIERMGKKIIVAIDEFQKIAEIDDKGWLEATLRTQMQQLKNVVFLFTGSRQSVIHDIINNPSRPFFRSCQPIEFPSFGPEFTDWIIGRFQKASVRCARDAVDHLRTLVQQTPNYIQMACFHLVAEGATTVTKKEINKVLRTIVRQNSYAYQTLLNSLTSIQQRSLRLAAKEEEQVFSKELLEKYEIPSSAAQASAIKSLKDKQILDEGTAKGKVIFDDPL